jgi:hypothetical protein
MIVAFLTFSYMFFNQWQIIKAVQKPTIKHKPLTPQNKKIIYFKTLSLSIAVSHCNSSYAHNSEDPQTHIS